MRSNQTGSASSTSLSLLERAKAHDPLAWTQITQVYSPLVYAWCRQFNVASDDAADVLQEVFRAAHRGLAGFRRDRPGDTFRGWLWTITRNKIRDYFREREGRPEAFGGTDAQVKFSQVPEDEPSTDDSSSSTGKADTVFLRSLELIRAEFEERTWSAFWLGAVDGAETADIATELGMSPNAVRTAKSRVLRRLRRDFRDLIE